MTIERPDRTHVARGTHILHLELGEWKLVQVHWSIAQSNAEVLGITLTVSREQLEEAIQLERPDLSGTLAADGTVTIVFTAPGMNPIAEHLFVWLNRGADSASRFFSLPYERVFEVGSRVEI